MARIGEGALAGIAAIRLPARKRGANGDDTPATLALVPYYAWNNRGNGSMTVWMKT